MTISDFHETMYTLYPGCALFALVLYDIISTKSVCISLTSLGILQLGYSVVPISAELEICGSGVSVPSQMVCKICFQVTTMLRDLEA